MPRRLTPAPLVGSLLFLLIAAFLVFTITMTSSSFVEEAFRLNNWNIGANIISGSNIDVDKYIQPLLGVKKIDIKEEDGILWMKLYYNYSVPRTNTLQASSSGVIVYKLRYSNVPAGFHMTGLVKYIGVNQYFAKGHSGLVFISLSYHLCVINSSLASKTFTTSPQQCVKEERLIIDTTYVDENVFKIGWLILGIFLPLIPVAVYIKSIETVEEVKGSSIFAVLLKYRRIVYSSVFLLGVCFLVFCFGLFLTVFPLIIIPYTVMILIAQILLILAIIAAYKVIIPLRGKTVVSLSGTLAQTLTSILFVLIEWTGVIVALGFSIILLVLMINVTAEQLSLLPVEAIEAYPLTSLLLLLLFSIIPFISSIMIHGEKSEEEIRYGVVVYLMLLNFWLFIIIFRVLMNNSNMLVYSVARVWLVAFIPIAIISSYLIIHLIERYTTYKALYDFYYKGEGLRLLSVSVLIVIAVTLVLSLLRGIGLVRPLPMLTDMIMFLQLALILIMWFIYVRTNVYQKVFIALEESFT